MPGRAFIGTSGWNYKHWRNLIYPERLAAKRWLHFMTQHFDTVEVNTSFYRIPKAESVSAWQQNTPGDFLFALKLWRGITHYRKLLNSGQFTANFLDVIQVLEPSRRAPLLIQLPPGQGKDLPKLMSYVNELRSLSDGAWRIAVEFRHSSWIDLETRQTLTSEDVALCVHDMEAKGETDQPNESSFVYVRRHGSGGGRYSGNYPPEAIASDARSIRNWIGEDRDVFVYYNNDIGGHAFWNAKELKRLVGVDERVT
jgi:uncharacterized protein YecE (DUF72 family)